jgi:hypothetical protein
MLIHAAVDQDIHPPRSGGAQRLFGLARGLARRHRVRVLCVVPNRSQAPAREQVEGVELVRLKAWHTSLAWRCERLGLAPMTLAEPGHRAQAGRYLAALGETPDVLACDLHLAGLLARSPARLRVHASQNVESDRFAASAPPVLARGWWTRRLRALEGRTVRSADLTVACSDEDAVRLRALHGVAEARIAVIANGYDEGAVAAPTAAQRAAARARLGVEASTHVAVFVGSDWGPNREALFHLLTRVGPALADAGHALWVVGSVGRAAAGRQAPWLRVFGEVDDLTTVLHAADAGVNPTTSGGGSNVKVPTLLAAGLACITTPFGLRGYAPLAPLCIVAEPEGFAEALRQRPRGWAITSPTPPAVLGAYAWGALGERLGELYEQHLRMGTTRGAA